MNSILGHSVPAWLILLALPVAAASVSSLPDVKTEKHPVTDAHHGTTVTESYRWLENAGAPEVKEWTRQQNERTRAYFSALSYREGLAQQLMQLRSEESARFFGLQEKQGRIFALRFKPPAQQPVLVRLSSLNPPALWKPVFDPNQYDTNGTTAIDWFVPSPDGKLVAVSLSKNGSEDGTLHFFEVDSGKELAERIPRVQYPTGGGSAAWLPDSTGILYARFPHPGERPEADLNFYQQVWRHRMGAPVSEDVYEIGKEFPRIAEIELEASEDGKTHVAIVANGDGGDFAHWVRGSSGEWRQISKFEEGAKAARFGRDNALYVLSLNDAPNGKLLRLEPGEFRLDQARTVVPESKGVIQDFAPCDDGVFVSLLNGGPSELKYYPKRGTRPKAIRTEPISAVLGLQSWHGNELTFGNVSYVDPFAWFTVTPEDKEPRKTALALTSPASFEDIEVVREFATSKDGTKVPLNILHRKGIRLDGSHPTLLYGYGGYGISLSPSFDSTRRVWFDAGGIYVVANLRGGGEYGETWHKAGNLTRKQNVFDDFIAAAEHLIKRNYTSPARLAVQGGSNGGLLMGAFLTQRPELARAVVSYVGIYDMLRVELDPNGAFNVTEFGTVKDPEQFRALLAYSPYHRVRDGEKYPAVLLTTGENDGRVNPMQSRKMTARLQEASGSGLPVLFRSTASAGHGIGTSLKERVAEQADVMTFLFDQLGVMTAPWEFQ